MRCNQKPFVTNDEDNITDKGSSGSSIAHRLLTSLLRSRAKLRKAPRPHGDGERCLTADRPLPKLQKAARVFYVFSLSQGVREKLPSAKARRRFFLSYFFYSSLFHVFRGQKTALSKVERDANHRLLRHFLRNPLERSTNN